MLASVHEDDSGFNELKQILKWIVPFAAFVWTGTVVWTTTESWQWCLGTSLVTLTIAAATLFGKPSAVRESWMLALKSLVAVAVAGVCLMIAYAGVVALIAVVTAIVLFPFNHPFIFLSGLLVLGAIASAIADPQPTSTGPTARPNSTRTHSRKSGEYATYHDSGRRRLFWEERLALWRNSDKCCYHCGKRLASSSPRSMHVDHKVPFSLGGSCDDDNLVASCPRCNLRKGNREDFDPTEPRKRRRRRKS